MSKQKQTASLPSYNKSYSRTWFQSSVVEYTWDIDRAITLFKIVKVLFSEAFPETALYRIKLNIDIDTSQILNSKLRFYLLTETEFMGICDCFVYSADFNQIPCKSTTGLISNMTLLYETTLESLGRDSFIRDRIVMYFKFEILHRFFTQSIHMDIIPSRTTIYKDLNPECAIRINFKANNKESITFIVNGERYDLPKTLLRAVNSKYFKNICDMYENNKNNIPYEIKIDDMPIAFKEMLSFILSGLLPESLDYYMLQDLLMVAHKYDVQTLKLICEHYLLRLINLKNSIDLVILAFSCNAKTLEKHTAIFIKFYLKEVVRLEEFNHLTQKHLDKIIELINNIKIPLKSEIIKLPHLDSTSNT